MLVRLRGSLDDYHQRRADKHGYLYLVKRKLGYGLVEATSVASGVVCTFDTNYLEEEPDAP